MLPALLDPVSAGQRLRLYYTNAHQVDRPTFADVLDARPDVDVDSVSVEGGRVVADVTILRATDRLGRLIFPTTFSGPDVSHELVEVVALDERGAVSTAARASWDNITEGIQSGVDRAAIPAGRYAETAREPLAVGGGLLLLLGLLVAAVWASVVLR